MTRPIDTDSIRAEAKKKGNLGLAVLGRDDVLALCNEVDELRYRLKGAHEKIRLLMQERNAAEGRTA